MPSSYTTSLRLTLPATGELTGTWGTTVNTGITELLDAAVAGTTTISSWGGAGVPYTLSNTDGAADEARRMFIVASGTPGEAKNVICPAVSKLYFFRNDTIGGFALTLKTSGGSGITVPAGQARVLYCNGTNVVEAFNAISSLTLGTALGAGSGGTGQSTYVIGDLLYATGTTALSKLGIGTNGQILTSTGTAPQWSTLSGVAVTTFSGGTTGLTPTPATSGAITLAGTLATTNGGTGLTSFTANRVLYTSSTSAIGQSANLTFDGTNLTAAGSITGSNATTSFVTDATNGFALFTGDPLNYNISRSGTNVSVKSAGPITLNAGGTSSVRFELGGSQQMLLTSTGLGIGTSSPTNKLTVAGGIDFSASAFLGSGTGIWSPGTNELGFVTAGTTRVRINATGDVGIGTAAPQNRLSVSGATQYLSLVNTTAGTSGSPSFAGIRFYGFTESASGLVAGIEAGNSQGSDQAGILRFLTAPTAGTAVERLRIDNAGNLLLANTTSQFAFDNSTTGNARSVIRLDTIGTDRNTQSPALLLFNGGTGTVNQMVKLAFSAASGSQANVIGADITAVFTEAATANARSTALVFSTANQTVSQGTFERVRITAAGDVGIGTSSPLSILTTAGSTNPTITIRNTTSAVTTGQTVGSLNWYTDDTSTLPDRIVASISAVASGDYTGTNNAPTDITFSTHSAGAAAAERMRLDSIGNLGLGVTPSAWGTGKAIEVGAQGVGIWGISSTDFYSVSNTRFDGANYRYVTTAAATAYQQFTGTHRWYNAASGTAGAAIAFTQAMTLDASGNLGIGTTSPAFKLDVQTLSSRFQVRDGASTGGTNAGTGLTSVNTANNALTDFNYRAAQHSFIAGASTTTAMLLDSSGNLGLGVTPSPWFTSWRVLDVARSGGLYADASGTNAVGITNNAYLNSGASAWVYKVTNFATHYQQSLGTHAWFTAPSGTAGNAVTFTEAARITTANTQVLYQPAESAQNTSVTLTVANLQTRIITSNAAVTLTLPTGTTLEGYTSSMATDTAFECTFIATTANAITIAANGNTTVGSLTVSGNTSGTFRFRKTATNTFTVYRVA